MQIRQFSKVLQMLGVACVVIASGCATAFVRSKNTVAPQHVFPATTFDGQFFWKSGVKGEPLFATIDPKAKNGPVTRVAYAIGTIIDLPFSIVFDTILLPMDLTRLGTPNEDSDTKRAIEQGRIAAEHQPSPGSSAAKVPSPDLPQTPSGGGGG